MGIEPLLALGQRLGVGHNLPNLSGFSGFVKQEMVNWNGNLGTDLQGCLQQEIERSAHRALGGILHGQNCHIHASLLGHGQGLIERCAWMHLHSMTK